MNDQQIGGGMIRIDQLTDVRFEIDRGVATLAIDRPSKLNAFSRHTLSELILCVEAASADRNVGVVVVTGVGGRAFSAGGDVEEESAETLVGDASFDELVKRLYAAFRSCPRPIIARVDGYAIGGGNHLAYMCDLTIASKRSVFGQNGARVASPAEGWLVSHLTSVIGLKRAKEMWMLCRRYDADRALDLGLINCVVPADRLDAEVRAWCDELLALSPTVLTCLKRSFDGALDEIRERQDAVSILAEINPDFWRSGEQEEGAKAFLEKRPPDFSPWR
jgi:dihydroxynaphthoic acid synthetase